MLGFSGVQVMYITLSFLLCSESSFKRSAKKEQRHVCDYYRESMNCSGYKTPICGTDGITYPDICIFCRISKETNGFINMAHFDNC
uniref:ovomucoid-like n=1 Tax=Myodes glareolus TaxID=447135 RepID=UPI00201FE6F2|nr:ovomucoid-like [Myodes glareolus]